MLAWKKKSEKKLADIGKTSSSDSIDEDVLEKHRFDFFDNPEIIQALALTNNANIKRRKTFNYAAKRHSLINREARCLLKSSIHNVKQMGAKLDMK